MNIMLLVELSTLVSAKANGTESLDRAMAHLLNYCITHLDAFIRYKTINISLTIHSNASYFYKPKAPSRSGRYHHTQYVRKNGPPTASNTPTDRQFQSINHYQHKYCPKKLQIHEHAFLLALRLLEPKTLSSLLGTRLAKPW